MAEELQPLNAAIFVYVTPEIQYVHWPAESHESSWVYFVWDSGFVLLWLTDGPQRSHLLLCHFGIAFHTFQHFWASTANFCPPSAERRRGGRRWCAQSLLASLKPDPAGPCLRCCVRTMTSFEYQDSTCFFCLYVPTTAHITCTMET